ncbi:hypothetical protein TRFO_28490 [Tritrichomonas foetus]|uniref:Uncharacterized protein n=1 Tax=Tritrichomonas foetus TaxID=1144522 RepID=A0A1J4JZZ3_9EUKA|nr:hypothetical protein TRFO_28490 [Tritrichomonas foetus]|eukprot:OHT04056.1 hypothetical protein TRFO_28490 [Tritrichomonas foetus]
MGVHSHTSRNKRLALLPKWDSVPMNWLSCPSYGDLIQSPGHPEITFLPIKTPLPINFFESLPASVRWTVSDAVNQARSKINNTAAKNVKIIAINVSASNEAVTKEEWESVGAIYYRIPIKKDFDSSFVDTFCETLNNEISQLNIQNNEKLNENKENLNENKENLNENNEKLSENNENLNESKDEQNDNLNNSILCMLYSGRGQNRVWFSIYSYFLKCFNQNFDEIVRTDNFYNQKALDSLCDIFHAEKREAIAKPDWLVNLQDERSISIGEVPLPLEKYKGIKKISRKEILGTEANLVKSLLPASRPIYQWDSHSLDELLSLPFQCTFDARGLQTFIVATKENSVFLVDSRKGVWLLRARIHHGQMPLVASCVLVEEQRRCVVLLTDLLRYGEIINENSDIELRLSILANKVIKKLRTENNSTYLLQFVYRPMAHVSDASKLKKDLPSLFAKCDGLLFYGHDKIIRLPLTPSVVLQFDYNGNDKAFLLASESPKSTESTNSSTPDSSLESAKNGKLVPVGIYTVMNKKLLGMDRRTSRFEYDVEKETWSAIALGQDDVPSTVEDVNNLIKFKKLNVSVDMILKELEKVEDL